MVGEVMECRVQQRWGNPGFFLMSTVVSLTLLMSPVTADILVMNTETNETSPIFEDQSAAFGPQFPHKGLAGRIVYAKPPDACSPVQRPPYPREYVIGWVLLVARGGHCGFADKVLTAQESGYNAVIVHNFKGEETLVKMYGNENGSFVNIPSSFVGWREGMRLKNEFNYTSKKFYVRVLEAQDINYRLYLWPFAIVVAVCFLLVMVFVVVKFIREHASRRINRLSKKHLKKIPVRKFKKGDYYDTCAICLDEYEEGEKIRVLPCDHVYHMKCIDPWLTKSKKTCPVCKRRVMPGRDADDSDSDNDGDTTNTSERTPLLTDNGSGSSTAPQYTASTNDPAVMSQWRQGRSPNSTLPTQSEGAQGAVGGEGISDQFAFPSEETDATPQLRHEAGSRRKRSRPEFRRAGIWQQDDGPIEFTVHGSRVEPETKEERRERRRKKKEKKRQAEELARQAMLASGNQAAGSRDVEEEAVEVATTEEELEARPAALVVEVITDMSGTIQGQPRIEVRGGGVPNDAESYVNPSFSGSEEVVPHNPGRRHEMNDMV